MDVARRCGRPAQRTAGWAACQALWAAGAACRAGTDAAAAASSVSGFIPRPVVLRQRQAAAARRAQAAEGARAAAAVLVSMRAASAGVEGAEAGGSVPPPAFGLLSGRSSGGADRADRSGDAGRSSEGAERADRSGDAGRSNEGADRADRSGGAGRLSGVADRADRSGGAGRSNGQADRADRTGGADAARVGGVGTSSTLAQEAAWQRLHILASWAKDEGYSNPAVDDWTSLPPFALPQQEDRAYPQPAFRRHVLASQQRLFALATGPSAGAVGRFRLALAGRTSERWHLYVDGGCRQSEGIGGAGVVLTLGPASAGLSLAELTHFIPACTSAAVAEWVALCLGLRLAAALGAPALSVTVDRERMFLVMSGRQVAQASGAPLPFALAQLAYGTLDAVPFRATFRAVPRVQNARADALATQAMNTRSSLCSTILGRPSPQAVLHAVQYGPGWHGALAWLSAGWDWRRALSWAEQHRLGLQLRGAAPGLRMSARRAQMAAELFGSSDDDDDVDDDDDNTADASGQAGDDGSGGLAIRGAGAAVVVAAGAHAERLLALGPDVSAVLFDLLAWDRGLRSLAISCRFLGGNCACCVTCSCTMGPGGISVLLRAHIEHSTRFVDIPRLLREEGTIRRRMRASHRTLAAEEHFARQQRAVGARGAEHQLELRRAAHHRRLRQLRRRLAPVVARLAASTSGQRAAHLNAIVRAHRQRALSDCRERRRPPSRGQSGPQQRRRRRLAALRRRLRLVEGADVPPEALPEFASFYIPLLLRLAIGRLVQVAKPGAAVAMALQQGRGWYPHWVHGRSGRLPGASLDDDITSMATTLLSCGDPSIAWALAVIATATSRHDHFGRHFIAPQYRAQSYRFFAADRARRSARQTEVDSRIVDLHQATSGHEQVFDVVGQPPSRRHGRSGKESERQHNRTSTSAAAQPQQQHNRTSTSAAAQPQQQHNRTSPSSPSPVESKAADPPLPEPNDDANSDNSCLAMELDEKEEAYYIQMAKSHAFTPAIDACDLTDKLLRDCLTVIENAFHAVNKAPQQERQIIHQAKKKAYRKFHTAFHLPRRRSPSR